MFLISANKRFHSFIHWNIYVVSTVFCLPHVTHNAIFSEAKVYVFTVFVTRRSRHQCESSHLINNINESWPWSHHVTCWGQLAVQYNMVLIEYNVSTHLTQVQAQLSIMNHQWMTLQSVTPLYCSHVVNMLSTVHHITIDTHYTLWVVQSTNGSLEASHVTDSNSSVNRLMVSAVWYHHSAEGHWMTTSHIPMGSTLAYLH